MTDLSKIRRILRDLKAPEYFLRQYPGLAAKVTEALENAGERKGERVGG
jgi:hypothetical protein